MPITKPNTYSRTWAIDALPIDVVDPGEPKYSNGWVVEIPPHEYFNWFWRDITAKLNFNNQNGINFFDVNTSYNLLGIVREDPSNGEVFGKIQYTSSVVDNSGNLLPRLNPQNITILEDNNWTAVADTSTATQAQRGYPTFTGDALRDYHDAIEKISVSSIMSQPVLPVATVGFQRPLLQLSTRLLPFGKTYKVKAVLHYRNNSGDSSMVPNVHLVTCKPFLDESPVQLNDSVIIGEGYVSTRPDASGDANLISDQYIIENQGGAVNSGISNPVQAKFTDSDANVQGVLSIEAIVKMEFPPSVIALAYEADGVNSGGAIFNRGYIEVIETYEEPPSLPPLINMDSDEYWSSSDFSWGGAFWSPTNSLVERTLQAAKNVTQWQPKYVKVNLTVSGGSNSNFRVIVALQNSSGDVVASNIGFADSITGGFIDLLLTIEDQSIAVGDWNQLRIISQDGTTVVEVNSILCSQLMGLSPNDKEKPPTPSGPVDPFYSNVVALLHGQGSDGGTTIVDNSQYSMTATTNDTVVTSTDESKWATSSLKSDYGLAGVGLEYGTNAANLSLGNGEYTIEAWVYYRGSDINVYSADGLFAFGVLNGNAFGQTPTGIYGNISPDAVAQNVWTHLAFTRTAANVKSLFVNGVETLNTGSDGADFSSMSDIRLASMIENGGTPSYFEDVRVTVGVNRYVGAFTPPAAPFPNQ